MVSFRTLVKKTNLKDMDKEWLTTEYSREASGSDDMLHEVGKTGSSNSTGRLCRHEVKMVLWPLFLLLLLLLLLLL